MYWINPNRPGSRIWFLPHRIRSLSMILWPPRLISRSTCSSSIELEYNFQECFNALTNKLDWNNPEGDRYLYDLTKPLPLQGESPNLTFAADYFFNNDMKHDGDDDDDEGPSAGPNQGKITKRRRTKMSDTAKKSSSSKESSKGKTPTKGSKAGKSALAKESVEEPIAEKSSSSKESSKGKAHMKGSKTGKSASANEPVEEPIAQVIMDEATNTEDDQSHDSSEPKTDRQTILVQATTKASYSGPIMEQASEDSLTFDDLMATPIDFSKYVLNLLKIDNLTQDILIGPTFNLLKGTCSSSIELEYNFQECFNALNNKLDWNNPEGDRYPYDLTKPLPLQGESPNLKVAADYFFNNDLEYLKSSDPTKNYATSITKTKAARYDIKRIEDMVPTLWSTIKHGYNKDVEKEIKHWVKGENCARIVYEDLDKQPRLMRANELYKFSDGILQAVRDELHHRIHDFSLGFNKEMPLRKWSKVDSALFWTMNENKTYNRNFANYKLYHALMEALLDDKEAMYKEVVDTVKDHKRKHDGDDDDDEGPSAGPNQATQLFRTQDRQTILVQATTKASYSGHRMKQASGCTGSTRTDLVQEYESYQRFLLYSTGLIHPKKSKGKGSQGKKTRDTAEENVNVSKESDPKPLVRNKTSRRRMLTHKEQEATDIMKDLKERRITSKRQPGTGGSDKGTSMIPEELLPAMLTQVGNQGNVGNQNGNVVNENVQENIGNVIVNGNRNHAMIGAGHAAYADRFHELARIVAAIEPKTIRKALQISSALTDEEERIRVLGPSVPPATPTMHPKGLVVHASTKVRLLMSTKASDKKQRQIVVVRDFPEVLIKMEMHSQVHNHFAVSADNGQFEQRVCPYVNQVVMYEDPHRQEAARKTVLVEKLEEKALIALAKEEVVFAEIRFKKLLVFLAQNNTVSYWSTLENGIQYQSFATLLSSSYFKFSLSFRQQR
uniref:Peptide-N(4)-(N-acetyl-beta-glucosaminyl) asparagine amidase isoform X2 n=1 Tax=Tanacetum cinerariifolium TaxID=118510 RepID=A0A6L2P308_TANCI|nr:peptide-N(4)-(N-acetyl-beta-glucosaminyl) asparagine amidase isoform X2 [Tanacetum cinerariifolium]